jgi:Predicted metal-binding integral membrane protein (DUF2182)/Tetratricopeptide repeat
LHTDDNVAIVANDFGLPAGAQLPSGPALPAGSWVNEQRAAPRNRSQHCSGGLVFSGVTAILPSVLLPYLAVSRSLRWVSYQWTSLNELCLAQCQRPFEFVMRHGGYRGDTPRSLMLGLRHGAYCVGCCWTLMALLLVGGVMNVLWVLLAVARLFGAGHFHGSPDCDTAEAERLYRILMKSDPTDASAPFNLGNMRKADGRSVEAEVALRAATRIDPTFADAWYNLSDLLDQQGRVEAAIECLRAVLRVRSITPMQSLTLRCCCNEETDIPEAADYWRRYLASDRQSEWATRARQSLKFCEMQINLIASA